MFFNYHTALVYVHTYIVYHDESFNNYVYDHVKNYNIYVHTYMVTYKTTIRYGIVHNNHLTQDAYIRTFR